MTEQALDTYLKEEIAAFPDYFSSLRAAEEGLDATLFFVVQMNGIASVSPNDRTHPAFGQALREAAAAGVRICARTCRVGPDRLEMDRPVPVIF